MEKPKRKHCKRCKKKTHKGMNYEIGNTQKEIWICDQCSATTKTQLQGIIK